MSRTATVRKYGKQSRKPKTDVVFTQLPQSPEKIRSVSEDPISKLTDQLISITLEDPSQDVVATRPRPEDDEDSESTPKPEGVLPDTELSETEPDLRVLTWADVCPPGDRIEKIAEASYAEVYRVINERGTSIIKVIRLDSPIKPQTKAQEKSRLVDEEPHSEADLHGELRISEWLADVPGFVVYKERYIVKGKASKGLLETHQTFHRRIKRKDPDRLQFYPSPSRYLDETRFLVVELGDAGIALEDFELVTTAQLWDIFLHVAIALARAEDQISFEHRDLHEGNLCVRQPGTSKANNGASDLYFGKSGLEITILDYGLSRAQDPTSRAQETVAFDLEKDLSIFTSTHAPQCKVYRQMRAFLLKGDRVYLPPSSHKTAYEHGLYGPISWSDYYPYTNVLWLAYLYEHLMSSFRGDRRELTTFKRTTKEFWTHLNPDAPAEILSFSSSMDVVRFAVESGWVSEKQLMGYKDGQELTDLADESCNESIIEIQIVERDESELRRSPRRRHPRVIDY